MAIARAHLADTSITRWYHCIARCVRRAFLLSEEPHDRKNGSNIDCKNLRESSQSRSAGCNACPGSFVSWLFSRNPLQSSRKVPTPS
jgi:hypothetical protein